MKGKAYANRKKESERPMNDFYPTPYALVDVLVNQFGYIPGKTVLDCCCGKKSIGNRLRHYFPDIELTERDLILGNNFLADDYGFSVQYTESKYKAPDYEIKHYDEYYKDIIMNPPFKFFDEFVIKSKGISDRVFCIGKIDFLNAHNRNINGLWDNLEWILPFDRKVAYDRPYRDDGKFECGMLNTGWFVWNAQYEGYPKVKVLDVNDYVVRKTDELR